MLALPALALGKPAPKAVEPLRFERMHVGGRLLSVHAVDLDGDARKDLIAIWASGAPPDVKRHVAIFFDHHGYHVEPDVDFIPPPATSFVTAADLDGDGKRELLLGEGDGLSIARLSGKAFLAPVRIVNQLAIALPPDSDDLPWLDLARDWDGDGRVAILVPLLDRLTFVRRAADGTWSRDGDLQVMPRATFRVRDELHEPRAPNYLVRTILTVPDLVLADWDGDGQRDLIAIIDDTLTVFAGTPAHRFATAPTAHVSLGVRTEAEAARGNAQVQITVRDLDGDGVADLAVSKVTGGLSAMHATLRFYFGTKGGGWGEPVQTMLREGFAGALAFADLDGDHRPELILPFTKVGFIEAARVLLTRRLSIGFEVHRNLGAKGFLEKPEIIHAVDFPIDYSANAEIDAPFPTLDGDFNGDGVPDFFAPAATDAVGVFLGGGKALVADVAKAFVKIASTRYVSVLDLDGNGRADVLLFYRFNKDHEGEIDVLRNSGKGW